MRYKHKITGEEVDVFQIGKAEKPSWLVNCIRELDVSVNTEGVWTFTGLAGAPTLTFGDFIGKWENGLFSVWKQHVFLDTHKPAEDQSDDPVLAPRHYRGDGTIECKHAAQSMMHGLSAVDVRGDDAVIKHVPSIAFYWWGCAFKYLWRWPWKNGLQDLKKCRETLDLLIDELEES